MKNFLAVLCSLAMILGLVGGANALPITFTDTTDFTSGITSLGEDYDSHGRGAVEKLDGFLDHVAWTHHFDFVPPADEVISGTLTLALRDDGGMRDWWEFGFGWAEDGTWGLGEVDTGSYSYDVGASFLEDGEFSLILASLGGDFYIDSSALEITYNPVPDHAAPVPEPATILLMGTGLLGLVAYSRKRFRQKS